MGDDTCVHCGAMSTRGRYGYLTGLCEEHEEVMRAARARARATLDRQAKPPEESWGPFRLGGRGR